MILFAEKNAELRNMFKEAFPHIEVAEDMFAVPEPKNVVTCSKLRLEKRNYEKRNT